MRPHQPTIRRRAVALALAYLLALQAILVVWAAVTPQLAGLPALAQASICATDAGDGSQPSGSIPLGCPCGPLCAASGCASCGPAPTVAHALVYRTACAVSRAPDAQPASVGRIASQPEQARAPPAMA